MHVAALKFKDPIRSIPVSIYIRYAPGSVLLGIVPEGWGDMEVELETGDSIDLIALFEQAITRANHSQQSPDSSVLVHQFKNLDGGEEAAFVISPAIDSLDVSVERSDEGKLPFRISLEDARDLVGALKTSATLASASPPT